MKHEILYLNSKRSYVRVEDTWYDAHVDLLPEIGQTFLLGKIEEVLSYEQYVNTYPEVKDEIYPYIADKTISKGFIRKVVDKVVKYGINPIDLQIGQSQSEALLN